MSPTIVCACGSHISEHFQVFEHATCRPSVVPDPTTQEEARRLHERFTQFQVRRRLEQIGVYVQHGHQSSQRKRGRYGKG
jgi:hypothetical protein